MHCPQNTAGKSKTKKCHCMQNRSEKQHKGGQDPMQDRKEKRIPCQQQNIRQTACQRSQKVCWSNAAQIQACYSPLHAVQSVQDHPQQEEYCKTWCSCGHLTGTEQPWCHASPDPHQNSTCCCQNGPQKQKTFSLCKQAHFPVYPFSHKKITPQPVYEVIFRFRTYLQPISGLRTILPARHRLEYSLYRCNCGCSSICCSRSVRCSSRYKPL